jgi:D-tyrosyl-tRNA(Tyr) deacylase
MKALVQRVSRAQVVVDGDVVGKIDTGLLVLLCVQKGDTQAEADYLAHKLQGLRVFSDTEGKMNLALADVGGKLLLVSQFTLAGKLEKGFRPSYMDAAGPEDAERLFDYCVQRLKQHYNLEVETGRFRTHMEVELVNDGPVTLMIEKEPPLVRAAPDILK